MVIKSLPVKVIAAVGAFVLGVVFFKWEGAKDLVLRAFEPEPGPPSPTPKWDRAVPPLVSDEERDHQRELNAQADRMERQRDRFRRHDRLDHVDADRALAGDDLDEPVTG